MRPRDPSTDAAQDDGGGAVRAATATRPWRRGAVAALVVASLLASAVVVALVRTRSAPGPAPWRSPAVPGMVVVAIDAAGEVVLREDGSADVVLGLLDRAVPARARATLLALRDALAARVRRPQDLEPDGTSRRLFVVAAHRATPWALAQWVLMTAAGPTVRVSTVRLDVPDVAAGPVLALPRDGSDFGDRQGVRRFVRATLAPSPAGPGTRVTAAIGEATWEAALEDERIAGREALDGVEALGPWLAARAELVRGRAGEVETPLPAGSDLAYGDVAAAIRALAAAGAAGVDLMGAPTPFPPRDR